MFSTATAIVSTADGNDANGRATANGNATVAAAIVSTDGESAGHTHV